MSGKRKVLASKHRPAYWPVGITVTGWLLFDRVGIPGWGWGVFWTLIAVLWLLCGYGIFTQEERTPKWEDQ